jgi:hypothetical protein
MEFTVRLLAGGVYIYIEREREKERNSGGGGGSAAHIHAWAVTQPIKTDTTFQVNA